MANAILVEPLALAAVTADSSAAGTEPAALADDMIGVVHRGTGTPTAWVEVDLGSSRAVDFAAFLATEGAATGQRVRAADTQADLTAAPTFDSGVVDFAAGAQAGAFGRVHSWWETSPAQSFRWWRFDINGLTEPFAAGRLVLGRRTAFARNFSFGGGPGVRDLGRMEMSTHGALDRRRGAQARLLAIAWEALTRAEVETTLMPMLESLGRTELLLVVTDPAPHDRRARRMFFGFIAEDIETVQRHFDIWAWRTRLTSMI